MASKLERDVTSSAVPDAFSRTRSPPLPRTSEEADDEGRGNAEAGSSRSSVSSTSGQKHHRPRSGSHDKAGDDEAAAAATASSSAAIAKSGASSTEGDDRRGRSASRRGQDEVARESRESPRSRTPSPILGSMSSSRGHLSFAPALEPTLEEVRMLLYGEDEKEEERPSDVSKQEMEDLEGRLKAMGLAHPSSDSNMSTRETELATMIQKVLHHSQLQDHYIDSLEVSLHNTRLRSISTLSSMRTSFAHSFSVEYELRARLEAELDDTRSQARKLSGMLARSENRNEEAERERAMSAEEEIMWQEEMKDHAGAYAQQQAARARAAQMAQRGPAPSSAEANALRTPSSKDRAGTTAGLDEPFEERTSANTESLSGIPKSSSDSNILGLGISSPSQAVGESSPLSTIIKERNKLLADKRYLKARARDAEAQRDRLEIELKSLRPLLVRGAPSKKEASSQLATPSAAGPVTPGRSQKRDRSRRRRQAVMGDAEAEHLLLAARRLSTRTPKEEGRLHTPPPIPSASQPRTPKTPRTAQTPRVPHPLDTITQSSASTRRPDTDVYPSANASPLASRSNDGPQARWGSHQRVDSNRSAGGIDDLLQAAQTVLSPSQRQRQSTQRMRANVPDSDQEDDMIYGSPSRGGPTSVARFTPAPLDASPKRRRVSGTSFDPPRRAANGLPLSPDKSVFHSSRRLRTNTEGAEPLLSQETVHPSGPGASQASALSALDLLADQATQSQQPSQSSDFSGSGDGEPSHIGPGSEVETEDGMHIDHEMVHMHGMPPNGSHYYPRGSYGHPYAHPPPINAVPMSHDGYRMMPGGQPAPYAYGPTGSPVSLSSQGWTSQNVPAPRNGLYSPPSSQPRFALQSGPRITTGHVAAMGPGTHPLASGAPHSLRNGGNRSGGSAQSDDSGDGEGDGGSNHGRSPQKGGNTSPDKRLPYVRWSEEEDHKLRKAIDEYGQRWELVARAVESRSYHQCRQRYLLMRRKDAAAREGMALSAAHGGNGTSGSSTGRSHSSAHAATVSSPMG